jgi:hypothetical protein
VFGSLTVMEVTQTCDKCKQKRKLTNRNHRQQGGWRELDGKDICPVCIREFFGDGGS